MYCLHFIPKPSGNGSFKTSNSSHKLGAAVTSECTRELNMKIKNGFYNKQFTQLFDIATASVAGFTILQMAQNTNREMDLTKSSETKHLYLGDSSGSPLPPI